MAIPTAQTILDNIDLAINAKLTGIIAGEVKEFSIGNKRLVEWSLDELRSLRKEYQQLASITKTGGIRKVIIRNMGSN